MINQFDDGENWHILKDCASNRFSNGITAISDAANAEPAYFVEKILPLAVELIQNTGVDHIDRIVKRRPRVQLENVRIPEIAILCEGESSFPFQELKCEINIHETVELTV